MTRTMKDSGIEWIGEIPEDWEIHRNKVVFSCNKEIVGENSNNIQLLSLTTGGVKTKDINSVGGKLPESFDTYQYVAIDNIIMCLFDLDMSAVFSGISNYNGMISPAYKVLKCNNNYIIPKYADYWFKFVFVDRKFATYAKNLRYTLSYDEFGVLSIPIPSLPEQQKIADFLDEKCSHIDSILEKTKASIDECKQLKQSVITQAVTKGIKPNRPMKDSGNKYYGEIPNNWYICKTLYCLSMPITDGPHSTPELFDTGIPFVSAEAVSCGNGSIDFNHIRGYISQEFYDECCLKYIPQINDVYMIKSGATTGKVSIVDTDRIFTIWSPLAVFRCNEKKTLPKFMYYAIQSDQYQKQIALNWSFGTQQNIGMRVLESLKICVPSLDEQQEIVSYLDEKCTEIDKLITKKEKLIAELETYKKSLIYEYVTGKKEVI